MLGTNPIAQHRSQHEGFLVHSVWPTIQGEGPYAGMPAIFLRLGGCNLRCRWCDTEFNEDLIPHSKESLIDAVASMVQAYSFGLVVITGGEPMLQPIKGLIDAQRHGGDPRLAAVHWQIETAGTVWPDGGLTDSASVQFPHLTIVCSPKTPKVARELISRTDVYWKYIIRTSDVLGDDGLPLSSTQTLGQPTHLFRPETVLASKALRRRHIFVQACDEGNAEINQSNLNLATKIAMEQGYRLSVQIHKVVGVP